MIDTDMIRKAANASRPHRFPEGIIGAPCSVCGARGMMAMDGCRRVKTVTFDAQTVVEIADEIDRLRREVDGR